MRRCAMVLGVMLAAWACGSDDAGTQQSAAVGAGGGGSFDGAVSCGGVVCRQFNGPGLALPLPACCFEAFTNSCGFRQGTSCRKQPPAHPTCASIDGTDFGFIYFGCCTDHKCGLLDESQSLGCRDIETLQAEATARGEEGFIEFPPAMSCD
jgi:hypothetical protein